MRMTLSEFPLNDLFCVCAQNKIAVLWMFFLPNTFSWFCYRNICQRRSAPVVSEEDGPIQKCEHPELPHQVSARAVEALPVSQSPGRWGEPRISPVQGLVSTGEAKLMFSQRRLFVRVCKQGDTFVSGVYAAPGSFLVWSGGSLWKEW